MQLTFGIRLDPDDQIAGMDATGHGESWHGLTARPRQSTTVINNKRVSPSIAPPTTAEDTGVLPPVIPSAGMQKRPSIINSLHDAFV